MGTLSVQPPSGAVRSLTEVFILLRNNAVQSRHIFSESGMGGGSEKMSLVPLTDPDDPDRDVEAGRASRVPPEWVNMVDEVQYELSRVRSKLKELKEMEQKHLMRPSFNEEGSEEEKLIEAVSQDMTRMLAHAHRLIQHIRSTGSPARRGDKFLLKNVTNALLQTLQQHTQEFRGTQTGYMKQLQSREDSFNQYFEAFETKDFPSSSSSFGKQQPDFPTVDLESLERGEEPRPMTMAQLQMLEDNSAMVKEREREVLHIAKSIMELNQIFKDLAGFVADQGTIVDRIDYNIEQSNIKVKAALKSVQKAEQYQKKNRKMLCIIGLTGAIIFFLFCLLIRKSI